MNERKIIEYQLVSASIHAKDFSAIINKRISDGYEVYGNPISQSISNDVYMFQVMVKYDRP